MSAQVQVKFLLSKGMDLVVNVPFLDDTAFITGMQLLVNDDLILSFPFTMDGDRYVRWAPGSDDNT